MIIDVFEQILRVFEKGCDCIRHKPFISPQQLKKTRDK